MGKNLIQQARGKGGPTYRAPSFRWKGIAEHKSISTTEGKGKIMDIIKCQGHSSPLSIIRWNDGVETLAITPEGIFVGQVIEMGENVQVKPGNISSLKNLPEGTLVCNIEGQAGDGGKYIRASGTYGKITAKVKDNVVIMMPSKKQKTFHSSCRAIVGMVSGGGRTEKPLVKAGNAYYKKKAKNKLYPIIGGTSQNAVDHPFGGKSSNTKGRPTQAPRNAPPGRKVGKIAPRQTGMKR